MGTVADKLNKLLGTKADIKAAITEKGQTVAEADTFASYAAKIRAIETTSKGMEWITSNMPSSGNWDSVVYGGGVFVAVANGKAAYSTDSGKTWTASTLSGTSSWISVAYGGGVFVTVAQSSNKSAYSTDGGKTWTASTLPSSVDWDSVAYGGGVFVTVERYFYGNQAAWSSIIKEL